MAVKKQTFVMSVVYNDEDTYAQSAVDAIEHNLFNEDGILEWDYTVINVEEVSASITDKDVEVASATKGSD